MPLVPFIFLVLACTAAFGQKSKLIISVSGELGIDIADVLMDGISYGLKNNDKYEILINDRQFKETLKKEWQKGNISDDRIIALAQNAGADYLCFTKIKSVKGLKGKQVTAQVYNLKTMSNTGEMGMETIDGDFSNLKHLTKIILDVVDDMLGTVKSNSDKGGNSKSFTDSRDGKQYKIVTIGKQTWMAENLNFNAKDSKCYDNKPANCDKYGRLYNWETARKICPKGWHLPNHAELAQLMKFIGETSIVIGDSARTKSGSHTTAMSEIDESGIFHETFHEYKTFADSAGTIIESHSTSEEDESATFHESLSIYISGHYPTAGTKLKATRDWLLSIGSKDTYGFSALPGGIYDSKSKFNDVGKEGYWWIDDICHREEKDGEVVKSMVCYMNMHYNTDNVESGPSYYNKNNLLSVRCLQD